VHVLLAARQRDASVVVGLDLKELLSPVLGALFDAHPELPDDLLGVLSGGERNRFALARLLVKPSNFLLLDEPTNHLDLRAKDVLLEALQGYTGTVVFVSHDRYFIDRLATRIFEVADRRITVFPGNYEDYQWRKTGAAGVLPQSGAEPVPFAEAAAAALPSKRLNPIKLRQLRERGLDGTGDRGPRSRDRGLRIRAGRFQERRGKHPPRRRARRAP